MNISFFTPVVYDNNPSTLQSFLGMVDDVFFLGGLRAHVVEKIESQDIEYVNLIEETPSCLSTALKVAFYFTVVGPLVALIVKAILRSMHTFQQITVKDKDQVIQDVDNQRITVKGTDQTTQDLELPDPFLELDLHIAKSLNEVPGLKEVEDLEKGPGSLEKDASAKETSEEKRLEMEKAANELFDKMKVLTPPILDCSKKILENPEPGKVILQNILNETLDVIENRSKEEEAPMPSGLSEPGKVILQNILNETLDVIDNRSKEEAAPNPRGLSDETIGEIDKFSLNMYGKSFKEGLTNPEEMKALLNTSAQLAMSDLDASEGSKDATAKEEEIDPEEVELFIDSLQLLMSAFGELIDSKDAKPKEEELD
jgi:hypothetical protein